MKKVAFLALSLAIIGCRNESAPGGVGLDAGSSQVSQVGHPLWQLGQEQTFSFVSNSSATMGVGRQFELKLEGEFAVKPMRVEGSKVTVLLALRAVKVHSQAAETSGEMERLSSELTQPHVFVLEGGKVVENRFAPKLSAIAASMQRMLAASLQVSDAPNGTTTWKAVEYDGTGRYETEYRLVDGGIEKKKLRYEDTLTIGKITTEQRKAVAPKVLRSTLRLALNQGAIREVSLDEVLQTGLLGQGDGMTVANQLTLKQLGMRRVDVLPTELAQLQEQTTPVPAERPYGVVSQRSVADEVREPTRTLAEVFVALERQASGKGELWGSRNDERVSEDVEVTRKKELGEQLSAFGDLVLLLRRQPGAIETTKAKIKSSPKLASRLASGLSAAGTPETQAALIELARDSKLKHGIRTDAATSLMLVKQPTPALVDALLEFARDPLLQDLGVYGLGTASRHLREAGEVQRADAAASKLAELVRGATNRSAQLRGLRGIANSGDATLLPLVQPFLSSADESLQKAAVEAMRLMQSAAVEPLVASAIGANKPTVQTVALRVAARRDPTDSLASVVEAAAKTDSNATVRLEAVTTLGRWLPKRPSLRSTLEHIAQADSDTLVQKSARRVLERKTTQS